MFQKHPFFLGKKNTPIKKSKEWISSPFTKLFGVQLNPFPNAIPGDHPIGRGSDSEVQSLWLGNVMRYDGDVLGPKHYATR